MFMYSRRTPSRYTRSSSSAASSGASGENWSSARSSAASWASVASEVTVSLSLMDESLRRHQVSFNPDANDEVSPRLGLQSCRSSNGPTQPTTRRLSCTGRPKTFVNWAAGRPFIWIDDEIRTADRDSVAQHYQAPSLLHRVDPRHGVTDSDFKYLGQWLAAQDGNDTHHPLTTGGSARYGSYRPHAGPPSTVHDRWNAAKRT